MNSSEPLPTTTSTPTVDELKEALSDAADDVATQPVNVNGESVQFVNVAEPVPPGMSSSVTDQLISFHFISFNVNNYSLDRLILVHIYLSLGFKYSCCRIAVCTTCQFSLFLLTEFLQLHWKNILNKVQH